MQSFSIIPLILFLAPSANGTRHFYHTKNTFRLVIRESGSKRRLGPQDKIEGKNACGVGPWWAAIMFTSTPFFFSSSEVLALTFYYSRFGKTFVKTSKATLYASLF